MPNFGFPTWPDEFGTGILQQLVLNVPGMTTDRVFWSSYDDNFHLQDPPADRFITLFMPNFPVKPGAVSGGGAYTTEFSSRLVVKGFIRTEPDPEGKTIQWLNDQAFGVLRFANSIISALQVWSGPIESSSGLSYFTEPMRLGPGFDLSKDNRGVQGSRWGIMTSNWEVAFVANLGKPYTGIIS